MLLLNDNRKGNNIINYKNPNHSQHDSIIAEFRTPPPTATMATVAVVFAGKIRKQPEIQPTFKPLRTNVNFAIYIDMYMISKG